MPSPRTQLAQSTLGSSAGRACRLPWVRRPGPGVEPGEGRAVGFGPEGPYFYRTGSVVIVMMTGSRDWADAGAVALALAECDDGTPMTLFHGDCPTGADAMAKEYAASQGWTVRDFPPDERLGKRGFYVRNKAMVDAGPDVCLAFIGPCTRLGCTRGPAGHDSHGTDMTVKLAGQAGIPVVEYR